MSYSTRKPRAWQEARRTPLFLLALTVAFFWPQIIQGHALYWGDIGLYFLPMTEFLRGQLLTGNLPLWNPWILCGTPFIGNPQAWPLYPATALLPLCSAPYFLSLTIALHVGIAAMGTYSFGRRALNFRQSAALFGAIVFAFGGELVSKEQFPNMVQAIAWLPWILVAVHQLIQTGRVPDALRLSVFLGLQILAAHAQITLLTLYLAAAYGVTLVLEQRPAAKVMLPRLATAGTIAAGLCACQVLPIIELYRDAWRQKLSFHAVNRFFLPFNQTSNFVLPALHGHPYAGNYFARGNFWETCCYVGLVPTTLAILGLWNVRHGRGARLMFFWLGVFIVGLWLAFGGAGGLYGLAYTVLPGFRSFHDPARCLLWSVWALALLAGNGWDALAHRIPQRLTRTTSILILGFAFFDLAHFSRTIYPLAPPSTLRPSEMAILNNDPVFAAHQARVLAPDTARVWQQFTSTRTYRQEFPNYAQKWADTLTPNLAMRYGLRDAYGYEPVTRRDAQIVTATIVNSLRPDASRAERQTAAFRAGRLGVRDIAFFRVQTPSAIFPNLVTHQTTATLAPLGKTRGAAQVYFTENSDWQPRARLTTRFVCVPSQTEALALMTQPKLAQETIYVGPPPFPQTTAQIEIAPQVQILTDTPDKVSLFTNNSVPSLLVLADTLSPGWHATVDGSPVLIHSVDGLLRGVVLSQPGTHQVSFQYCPASFRLGLYLSLVTITALMACVLTQLVMNSKIPKSQAGDFLRHPE